MADTPINTDKDEMASKEARELFEGQCQLKFDEGTGAEGWAEMMYGLFTGGTAPITFDVSAQAIRSLLGI